MTDRNWRFACLAATVVLSLGWVRSSAAQTVPWPPIVPEFTFELEDGSQPELSAARGRAARREKRSGTSGRTTGRAASGGQLSVPVDVGFGPLAVLPNPPLFQDQYVHGALALSIGAIIDRELIAANRDRIPEAYRKQADGVGQVTYRPWFLALIPELLIISPAIFNTGMYGAVWHPLGIGVSLIDSPVRFTVGAQLALAYLFIHSATLPEPTHFLWPGLSVEAVLTLPLSKSFLLSTGWSSDFFIPQPLGQPPWSIWPLDSSLWHLGGPFLKAHVRFPYTVTM